MFLLKKLISHMIYPVPILMGLAFIVLFFAIRHKKKPFFTGLSLFRLDSLRPSPLNRFPDLW